MTPRRALVIGGSMSGLFSALFLRRRGWEVAVYERTPTALTGRGAGIMTHPEMRRALGELGLDTSRDFGVGIEHRVMLDAAGTTLARRRLPQIATSWNRLYEMLGGALGRAAYRLGKDLVRVTQDADGVTAHFADGTTQKGDPNLRLGCMVSLQGLGSRFDNDYQVVFTRHRWDRLVGYKTDFTAESAYFGRIA